MPTTTPDSDAIFNRATIALTKSQRLIASWLPPPTPSELLNGKTAEELEREEQEMFVPVPELLGLGAPLPQEVRDGDSNRRELSSNDKLRKQLLGREFAKLYGGRNGGKGGPKPLPMGSKPRPMEVRKLVEEEEEEEEEEGRSTLGRAKRMRKAEDEGVNGRNGDSDENNRGHRFGGGEKARPGKVSKRPSNYLDEVLAEKERKKQKKKSKKKENKVVGGAVQSM